jgi:hypothetical protein
MLGEGSKRFQHMDDKGSNLSDEEEWLMCDLIA